MFFFLFKQKTAYDMRISDWSSDVCSSDLVGPAHRGLDDLVQRTERHHGRHLQLAPDERFDMKKFHAQRGNFASRGSRRSSVSIHAASIDRKSTRLNSSH